MKWPLLPALHKDQLDKMLPGYRLYVNNTEKAAALIPVARSSFTMSAAASTFVADTNVIAGAHIPLTPANRAASALIRLHGAYVSGIIPGQGFSVNTDDGAAATGMENFNYTITY